MTSGDGKTTPRDTDMLLVIDVQNDFCPGGALQVPGGDEVVPIINRLALAFGDLLVTQDWHPPGHRSFASSHPGKAPFETIELSYGTQVLWPDHCVQGTKGAGLHEDLALPNAGLLIRKGFRPEIDSYSAFYENDHKTPTGLTGYLRARGFERLFLAGLATDFCVHFSAMDAAKEGFNVVVIEDACRAIDLEGSLAKARQAWPAAGVQVTSSAALGL